MSEERDEPAWTHLRDGVSGLVTQAAEGLPRRRFTVAEIEAMVAAGIINEDERIELIGGEVVPMAAKGSRHEVVKIELNNYWVKRLPDHIRLAPETTFRLSPDTYLEPDFIFFDKATPLEDLKGDMVHLAVEVADSSYGYDTGRKAALYASFGIPELWVINVKSLESLETRIHRNPSPQGYLHVEDFGSAAKLVPAFASELAVKLDDLEEVNRKMKRDALRAALEKHRQAPRQKMG